jgi:hypothetical protein
LPGKIGQASPHPIVAGVRPVRDEIARRVHGLLASLEVPVG